MDTPQEIQVWYILPALRKKYALSLKSKGLKQKQIAKLMHVTESAISQYIKNKRANIILSKKIDNTIEKSVKTILEKKSDFKIELQKTLKIINKEKIICNICKTHTKADENCNVCYM